jgi:hypothetical protein
MLVCKWLTEQAKNRLEELFLGDVMPIPSTTTQDKPQALKQGCETPALPQDLEKKYVSEDAFIEEKAMGFGENLTQASGIDFDGHSLNRDPDYYSGEGYATEYTKGDQLPPARYRAGQEQVSNQGREQDKTENK